MQIFMFALFNCAQAIDDYYQPDYIKFDNVVYRPNIKTVQLAPENASFAFPVLELNSNELLQLSFDDLDADRKTYSYSLVHCDANWNPSNLVHSEYITGYNDEQIQDYRFSFNSIQRYTHYSLYFPSEGMKITKSGNYLIKVFQDYEPNNLVLTRRFVVFDRKVDINATAHAATIISDRYTKQEVDFTIVNSEFEINDPYENLKVVLLQNQRFDNAITKLKPTFTKPGQLVYDMDEGNVFWAGNEYRYFEDRVFNSPNERVAKYAFDSAKQNHIYLLPEEKRTFRRYSTMRDINGNFLIQTTNNYDGATDADYAFVHFYLPCDAPLIGSDVYLFGAMTDWKYLPEFKMTYNSTSKAYIAAPYLKQGFYNYAFVELKSDSNVALEGTFESNHFETENDYYILVYYRTFGTYYDQLIGYKRINSTVK